MTTEQKKTLEVLESLYGRVLRSRITHTEIDNSRTNDEVHLLQDHLLRVVDIVPCTFMFVGWDIGRLPGRKRTLKTLTEVTFSVSAVELPVVSAVSFDGSPWYSTDIIIVGLVFGLGLGLGVVYECRKTGLALTCVVEGGGWGGVGHCEDVDFI